MTPPTVTIPAALLTTALEHEGKWYPLPDGGQFRVRLVPDENPWDENPEGTLHDRRPEGEHFEVLTRGGYLYWTPPEWFIDPDDRDSVLERLRSYHLDEWSWIGVMVERRSPFVVGPFGGMIQEERAESLWGIESDATEYIAEVVVEVALEAGIEVEE